MHTVPDTSASDAHFLSGFAPCAHTGLASTAAGTSITRTPCLMALFLGFGFWARSVRALERKASYPRARTAKRQLQGRVPWAEVCGTL